MFLTSLPLAKHLVGSVRSFQSSCSDFLSPRHHTGGDVSQMQRGEMILKVKGFCKHSAGGCKDSGSGGGCGDALFL